MTKTLHIRLLGEFHMLLRESSSQDGDAGTPLSAAISLSPLEQTLLAYLLLHREAPQSRQQISYHFWPDSTDAQARSQLRKLYYRMRRHVPDPEVYLKAETQTVQWRPEGPYKLDVAEFDRTLDEVEQELAKSERGGPALPRVQICEALEHAVSLYVGDLLPNCYEDWIAPERLRLSQRFVHALEQLVSLREEAREYERAIEVAERLLRYDPLHEACYGSLMRLYALTGNRARALRTYHTCATVLQRELGVEPSASTQQAYQRLLQVEPPVQPVRVEPKIQKPIAAYSEPSPTGLAVVTPLVGRRAEWDALRALWQNVSQGVPQVALIQGEAGIGKTRLAEELIRWVQQQGGAAYTAHCYQAEGALAYAPVVQWLRAQRLPPLEPVWQRELARLLPELLNAPGMKAPGPMTEPWQRQRFFQALASAFSTVLSATQRRPLLLLLDDIQWCDLETLEWLHYFLRHDPRAPLLVLCTLRLEEMDDEHPLAAWLRALRRAGKLTELTLGPLNEEETHALATQVAQQELDPDLAACIHGETEGNPLFVVELARAGRLVAGREPECPPQGLPPRIQATIEDRLAQLSQMARDLAGLAATIGHEFSFTVLAGACELDQDTLLRALDELWQRRVVREHGGDSYDFTHDKLRQVAYAQMSVARQREMHRRAAGALEAVYAGELDRISGQVAAHHERAGEKQRAIPYHLRAAHLAGEVYANRVASDHYARALALLPVDDGGSGHHDGEQAEWRLEALGGLGQVRLRLGQPDRAERLLGQAIDLGRTLSVPPLQLARLTYWQGRALHLLMRYKDEIYTGSKGLVALGLALEDLVKADELKATGSLEAALLLSTVAVGHDYAGDRAQARALWYRLAAMVEKLDDSPELASIYPEVGIRYLRDKNLEGAQRWLRLVERKTASSQDERTLSLLSEQRERVLSQQGDLRGALPHRRQALDHAIREGNLSQRHFHTWWVSFTHLFLGDLDQADRWSRQMLDLEAHMDVMFHTVWSDWLRGLLSFCRGGQSEAMAALEQAATRAQQVGYPEVEIWSNRILGRAHLDRGERAAALQRYQRAAALYTPEMVRHWRAREMRPYALFFAGLLSGLEEAFGDPAAFRTFCQGFPNREQMIDGARCSPDLDELALGQWYLELVAPALFPGSAGASIDLLPGELLQISQAQPFPPGWAWHDPFADCRFEAQDGVNIEAANGRDLWRLNRSAPRLLVPLATLSSDRASGVAIETICAPAFADRPAMGGLLLWIDAQNYLRLDRGLSGPNEITLLGCLEDRDMLVGRGRLPPEPGTSGATDCLGRAWLRLEWRSGVVRALCSANGETWYTAGQIKLPFDCNAQIGLYANGNIDRTIYHGAYPDGAALLFESLRCWIA